MIILIAAMAHHRVMGNNNQLPWQMPADLQHFKRMTMGKPMVMGRKTFDSLGRPLPGRRNIVVTRQAWKAPGVEVFHSLEEALMSAPREPEVMVIGGADIFKQALPRAEKMILTMINVEIEGDVFFPEWSTAEWREASRENFQKDNRNPYDYSFVEWVRV